MATPLWDRANAYIDGVLDGSIPSNRWARLACERHRRDEARSRTDPAWPFYFDVNKAEELCRFIETMPHVEGPSAGLPLRLDPWQAFIMATLNGWRERATRQRRFRTAYIEVPRKNGKTTLVAPLGLYGLTLDHEPGAKVFSAATSQDQARLVFDIARIMADRNDAFREAFGVTVERHAIRTSDDAAVFKAISAQTRSKDGKNASVAIIDELHEHPDSSVYDSLESSTAARLQPLLIAITTAGSNVGGVCYRKHLYVRKLLEGIHEDDAFFGIIYSADEDADPADPATWAKANPALGSAKQPKVLEDEWRKAVGDPSTMGEFLRKHLCIWTSVGASAFDLDGWRKGIDPELDWEHYRGAGGILGLDMSVREDLTSLVATVHDGDRLVVRARHFTTETVVNREGNDNLAGWARDGKLTVCPGAMIDQKMVEAAIIEMSEFFGSEMVSYDPAFAALLASSCSEQGLAMVEFRQTPMNLHQPLQNLIGLAEEGRIVTDGDPVLYWMVGNTIVEPRGDFSKPAKRSPEEKIDGVAAMVSAYAIMAAPPEASTPSYLEEGELLVL